MLTLRPFNKKDLPLLARWLYGEHAASRIESPEDWLAELHDRDSAFTHIVAEVDGKPMGCCRYREAPSCYTEQEWAEIMQKLPRCAPPGKEFDMDYLIGELEYIPPGYGRVMLDRMVDLLYRQGATHVVVTPEEGDKAAKQFLESCYFLWEGGFYTHR